jgi:hypothetical protein
MNKTIELSPDETPKSLFKRWKGLKKEERKSLVWEIKRKIKEGVFEEQILDDFKSLVEEYKKILEEVKAMTTPEVTEAQCQNRKDSDALNEYLLKKCNEFVKYDFIDEEVKSLFNKPKEENPEKQQGTIDVSLLEDVTEIKQFSRSFWIRLSRILGGQGLGVKHWKQKYSYLLALETLKRNEKTFEYFLSGHISDIRHLENIILKVIKDNCKITLIQMQLDLKRRKEEEKRLQKEREIEKNQDEVNAKFKRRLENLPPEEDCWFEDELM